tara:strand:- start:418 stop:5211 length:4794 start_codon:yes stop_codon:yes gene_type:complete
LKNFISFFVLLFFTFTYSNIESQSLIQDSLKIEKYKNHISTLKYISRENHNNDYFLDLALKYIDSIRLLEKDNNYVGDIEKGILLTKNTTQNNVISKIEFFKFYSGLPPYYGFVDDAIEYAYDDALSQLLNTRYRVLGNAPLSDVGITSILIRGDCDNETFEIVNQTLISNTNHRILQIDDLIKIIGGENSTALTNGLIIEDDIKKIIDNLNLDRLGVFSVGNIDIINNKIWLVNTDFKTYVKSQGFIESIFTRGYTVDKRDLPLLLELLLVLILAILFVSLAYGFSLIFINRKNILISTKDSNKELLISVLNKVKYVALYFFLPIILSFTMIYVCSFIIPSSDVDVGEVSVTVWLLSLTILMSFFPIIINLFIVNRLDIDGFHTPLGYTFFFNSSLYATYFPIFIFYFIQYETYPFLVHILLIFITLLIGNLLGKSYFQFGILTKNNYKRRQAVTGLFLGLIALIIFNRIIIYELSVQNLFLSFIIISPISILNHILDNYLDRLFEKKSKESTESSILDEVPYIKTVMNPGKSIYKAVENKMSDDLNIMLIDAPMGIGKTRSLKESYINFEENNWNIFYGDCDEIQDENAVSFEPFLQAFSRLIGENWNSRSESTDKITKGIINIASDKVGIPLEFSDFNSSSKKTMNEISLEIIDKLTKINKKVLFIMEDVHWIDPETLTLLKHFIRTVNRNFFLRKNLCIIITVRAEIKGSYRGLNYEEIKKELNNLNDATNNCFDLRDLLDVDSFNLIDFVKNLSIQKNKFKIASSSMNQINNLFNDYNKQLKSESKIKLTPLYVFKVLESWISDESLKYTPDGYFLTKTVDIESLPNFEDIDSYYHTIFHSYEPKWRRILESASVIGNKFDADILAQVWGYELLDVLDFLENAVNKGLLIDVSNQDNIYKFSDKRIISALKSYFKDDNIQNEGDKQIVIEYNKRYIELHSDIIKHPEKFSSEEVLKVIRRMITLSFSKDYRNQCNNLILDIVCRYLYSNKLGKLDAFANLLEKKDFTELSDLLKKLRIIADDVNFSFAEKKKILDNLSDEEKRKSKIPLPNGINTDELSNDLRLLIILKGEIMNTSEKSIVTSTDAGFSSNNFETFIPVLNKFPTKLNGLSLIYFIKDLGDINLSLDDEVELILSGGFEERQKSIEAGQKVMFDMALKQLKNTEFYELALREYELWKIEKNSTNVGNSKEKIEEVVNKYEKLIGTQKEKNPKFLYDSINSYLNYCHLNFKDGKKSNEVFINYNEMLKIDGKISEAWVLTFIKFILSTTPGSSKKSYYNSKSDSVRPGEIYLSSNTKIADTQFDDTNDFLNKILDSNSITKASIWFLDAKKTHYLSKKDFISYKNSQLEYLNSLKLSFNEDSPEFNKACINIANDLLWQTENEPSCPNFYDDCIKLWKKALNYVLYQKQLSDELSLPNPLIDHFRLAQRYQKVADLYLKKKSFKNAFSYTKKALESHHNNYKDRAPGKWDFIDGELIPLSKDTKELFYTKSGRERMTIIGYGLCILNYARCLSMQEKYNEAIEMIDKACKYYYIFPKLYNLSQLEKGINLIKNNSKTGTKLIKDSLNNLDKLDKKFKKSETELIQQAKQLIKK